MEVLPEGLVGGQKYWLVNATAPGYAAVHFIQRKQAPVPPGQPVEEQPPVILQLSILDGNDSPVHTVNVHPAMVKFFDDELEAATIATAFAYTLLVSLRQRCDQLSNDKPIILPGGGKVGPAPSRMIIKPGE